MLTQIRTALPNQIRVLFYLPNLIGYLRIFLLVLVMATAIHYPIITFIAFTVCGNLDALDGYCARRFQQTSQIGTILDYAIDRASDVLLFLILAMIYSHVWMFFCAMLMLDIFSHICQLYATVFSKCENHKIVGEHQSALLKVYYSNRAILYFACAFHDGWLICLYLYHFFPLSWIAYLSFLFLPGFLFKSLIHVLQIGSVFKNVIQTETT